jgi:hypothetical protein
MYVTINHTCGVFATHTTRADAMAAARCCRAGGDYATVWTLADAQRLGALRGLRDVTADARPF